MIVAIVTLYLLFAVLLASDAWIDAEIIRAGAAAPGKVEGAIIELMGGHVSVRGVIAAIVAGGLWLIGATWFATVVLTVLIAAVTLLVWNNSRLLPWADTMKSEA